MTLFISWFILEENITENYPYVYSLTILDMVYNNGILPKGPKGPTRHAYAWQIGPLWQDTLELLSDIWRCCKNMTLSQAYHPMAAQF